MSYFLAAGRAEVAHGDVHHPVGQAERLRRSPPRSASSSLVELPRLLGQRSRRTSRPCRTGAPGTCPWCPCPPRPASRRKFVVNAGVPGGQLRLLQPLVGVDPGQRDLGGAGQVQVVLLQVVEVGLLGRQEAGAVHGPLAGQDRRQHEQEPLAGQLVDDEPVQRHLGQRHVADPVGEPGARTAARPWPCRSSRAASRGQVRPCGSKPNFGCSPQVRTSCASSSSMPSAAVGSGRFGIRASSSSRSLRGVRLLRLRRGQLRRASCAQLGELVRARACPWTTSSARRAAPRPARCAHASGRRRRAARRSPPPRRAGPARPGTGRAPAGPP